MTRELEPWRQWLNRYDAAPVPGPLQAWTVTIDEVGVVLELEPPSRVRVSVPLMADLAALSIVAKEQALYTKKRVFTGDASLDDAVVIHVPHIAVYGAFDAATRAGLRHLVALGVTASGGMLRWAPDEEHPDIASVVVGMVEVARRLALPEHEARMAIAHIIERDPNPSVRATYERAFGSAPDIRDARAALVTESATDDQVRLQLLAQQVSDPRLSAATREAALKAVLDDFPFARIEPFVLQMPRGVRSFVLAVLRRLERETDLEAKRSGGRMALHLAHGASLGASEIKAMAGVLAPLALPQALDFFLACIERLDGGVVQHGFEGLLLLDDHVDVVSSRVPATLQLRMARALPGLAWGKPERVNAIYDRFYTRHGMSDAELQLSYLNTMAAAHRWLRETGGPPHAYRGQHLGLARSLLGGQREVITVAAACDLLAEVGEVADIAQLNPMTEGFFRSSIVKEAARNAIALIMKRENVRAETGALALSEGNVGGLSEPESP